jgi:hypothetical protein
MRPLRHPDLLPEARQISVEYQKLGKYYVDYFGLYCTTCEAPLATGLQVDHRGAPWSKEPEPDTTRTKSPTRSYVLRARTESHDKSM